MYKYTATTTTTTRLQVHIFALIPPSDTNAQGRSALIAQLPLRPTNFHQGTEMHQTKSERNKGRQETRESYNRAV